MPRLEGCKKSPVTPIVLVMVVAFAVVSMYRMGGRYAFRLAFQQIRFFFTRPSILLGWGIGALAWFAYLWRSSQPSHLRSPGDYLAFAAIALITGGGSAIALIGPAFMLMRWSKPKPQAEFDPGEQVLSELATNHVLNGESRGGKLFITKQRLLFVPHRFNVQLASWSAPLKDIERAEVSGERLLVVHVATSDKPEVLVVRSAGGLERAIGEALDDQGRRKSQRSV
ncbi:MAG TPA: hypothetical protein PKO46_23155 [Sedimentisphaerales bacterium]|nr:hypothetical protein [Sedimentisphaerales bacterium]